jgi:hypothetical protein
MVTSRVDSQETDRFLRAGGQLVRPPSDFATAAVVVTEYGGLVNNMNQPRRRTGLRVAGIAGVLVSGAIIGGVFAGSLSASAASGTAAPTASSGATEQADAHGSKSVRSGETVVTGTNYDTLKAAALKAVPGGTVYRIETDADGAAYEAHMTRADGSEVTVKFDKNLAVTATQDGMGSHK